MTRENFDGGKLEDKRGNGTMNLNFVLVIQRIKFNSLSGWLEYSLSREDCGNGKIGASMFGRWNERMQLDAIPSMWLTTLHKMSWETGFNLDVHISVAIIYKLFI